MSKAEKKLPQAMRPHGRIGRIFGWLMGRMNKSAHLWTVDQLRNTHPKSVLEIGFGTGQLLKLAAKKLKPARLDGVDPSELMLETAQKKMRKFRKKMEVNLKLGDDASIPVTGSYDAIVALHSFQFWSHPATTLGHIRSILSPNGRFVLVLRLHGKRSKAPNPLSRTGDEATQAIKAAEQAGFAMLGMNGISKTSQGLVFGPG